MIDESERLRDLMESMPVPPPRLDIAQAVRDGRRSVQRSRYTMASVAAALVVLALAGVYAGVEHLRAGPRRVGPQPAVSGHPTPAASTPTPTSTPTRTPDGLAGPVLDCTVEPLTMPSGAAPAVLAIDPTGHYVINNLPFVLWTDGRPQVVSTDNHTVAHAVNAHAVVVGDYDATGRSWFYDGTRLHTLPRLPGYASTSAEGINERGDIVGFAEGVTGPSVAVIWPAAQPGTVHSLAAPANPYGAKASAIGDDGTVVGMFGDGGGAFVWDPAGHGRLLPDPPYTSGGFADAISGDWVSGAVSPVPNPGASGQAARWNLRTGESTALSEATWPASGVTSSGAVVVNLGPPEPALFGHDAPLGQLPTPSGLRFAVATEVSSDGKVVVGTIGNDVMNPNAEAVIWRC